VGLRLTDLVPGSYQMSLFEDSAQLISLYQAMDNIKNRFGKDAVGRAVGFNFSR